MSTYLLFNVACVKLQFRYNKELNTINFYDSENNS